MITRIKELFKFLWPFCSENKKYFYILSFFISFSVVLELPLPLFLKYFIDHIIKTGDMKQLQMFSILLVSLIILKFFIDNVQQFFLFTFRENTFINLQRFVFKKTLRVQYRFFEENSTGYIVSRIHNELHQMQNFMWDFFVKVFTDILMFLVGVYFIFSYSVKLALLSLTLLPLFIATLKIFSNQIEKHSEHFNESYSRLFGFFYEMMNLIFLVKAFLLRNYAEKKLESNLRDFYKVKLRKNVVNVFFTTLIAFLGSLSPVIVLYVGGIEIFEGRLTLGSLIAFNSFLAYIFGPTKKFLNYGAELISAITSLNRLRSLIAIEEIKEGSQEITHIKNVRFDDVSFSYNSRKTLSHISFELLKGERIGIVGKIGSGKSTLIKLMLGLYDDYSGKIRFNGISLRYIKSITKKIGIIPQENFLLSDSILENIRIGDTDRNINDADEIIDSLDLSELISNKGFNHKILSSGGDLSGGEKQKIAAARLMFRDPDIVIIDEGTSNLDAQSEYIIREAIFNRYRDKMVIIVSHRFNNITKCDKIIYLKDGEIVAIGSHEFLIKKYPDYRSLYKMQK